MNKIRLALVGCGGMARAHLNAYRSLVQRGVDWFEISAVCDPTVERARDLAQRTGEFQEAPATVYADFNEMLTKETLHCVDTPTPDYLHHTIATIYRDGSSNWTSKQLSVRMASQLSRVSDK